MMEFITISRQMGTNGTEIAGQVAEKLGYRLIDNKAIEAAARDMGLLGSVEEMDEKRLVAKARKSPEMTGRDLTSQVTTAEPYRWDEVDRTPFALAPLAKTKLNGRRWNVI